jgi:hypothetical protein
LVDGVDGVEEAACGAVMSGAGYLRRQRCNSCATHGMLPRRSKYLTSTA